MAGLRRMMPSCRLRISNASCLARQPVAGAANNPPLEEIQRVFDAVHQQSLAELGERTDEELDVPLEQPRPLFKTKLGAVEWCAQHEFVHAGQIATFAAIDGQSAAAIEVRQQQEIQLGDDLRDAVYKKRVSGNGGGVGGCGCAWARSTSGRSTSASFRHLKNCSGPIRSPGQRRVLRATRGQSC